ncbi:POLE2 [Cordylochernes scorpioides]|uniref:DNA polymerase epsilon subunit n=1 Tax=Cordylochernes scorpioides TaxID=51811 RepID=A0ABY6JVQ7_9ARAC|nr:POLE2 [Cordylochernes scorpioides]
MESTIKSKVITTFQLNGLTLRRDASQYLVSMLGSVPPEVLDPSLDIVIKNVQKLPLTSPMVDLATLEPIVAECMASGDDSSQGIFNVIDAFTVPHFTYNPDQRKLILKDSVKHSLFGSAEAKAQLFQDRYRVIQQRTLRHKLFAPQPLVSSERQQEGGFVLRPVEFLLGSSMRQGNVLSLGMLTQMKEGKYYLEDPSGSVQLDLSKTVSLDPAASYRGGIFTDHAFVLAEGFYEDHIFHVQTLGFPPLEPSSLTRRSGGCRQHFGTANLFGGPSSTTVKTNEKMRRLEANNPDAMIVILSDVWLDQIKVLEKLQVLFTGYANMAPVCFLLLGNFLSQPHGSHQPKVMKECLRKLAALIAEHPTLLEDSHFVFVPGPRDVGMANILPRPGLPDQVTEEFRRKVPKSVFTTNPCRLQWGTKEVVVLREDVGAKLCRSALYVPAEVTGATVARTLAANGHLLPLPLAAAPVFWPHDPALWLYPLPDLVVLGSRGASWGACPVAGCTFLYPGSFVINQFSFKVYMPASGDIEDSQIPSDT